MNFIKEVFEGKESDSSHRQFIRFGKGEYGGRAVIGMWKTKNIKIRGSFEFANDFVNFASGLANIKFSGTIWSRNELEGMEGKRKEGKWIYEAKDIPSSKIVEMSGKIYCFLLNAEGEGIKLKIKPKLPKPGKSEGKTDDKFCQMEIDEKYYKKAKDDFFWDLPEGKKISVEHRYIITEIVPPRGEKDFNKIREMAKRKGKIIRKADVDGKEIKREVNFEA